MSLSIDTANRVINEQEDAIAELRHKVSETEDERDLLVDKIKDLKDALHRIQFSKDLMIAQNIAMQARL